MCVTVCVVVHPSFRLDQPILAKCWTCQQVAILTPQTFGSIPWTEASPVL